MLTTPVLIITFNRAQYAQRVLEAVLAVQPQSVYIFQDGARLGNASDVEKCQQVRDMVAEMLAAHQKKHSVEVQTYYSEKNLGCGPGPMTAISWFFDHVDKGIIIEDDAVPNSDFFFYAQELLERYESDTSVRVIGSMNVDLHPWGDGAYYFSMMNRNLCAWATWRRSWQYFDLRLMGTSRRQLGRALRRYGCGAWERAYWEDRLDEVHKDGCKGASWDMQFFMSIWLRHEKGIIPNVNLCSNIGTVGEATHAMGAGNIIDSVPTHPILPLRHPSSSQIQSESDRQFFFRYFEPGKDKMGTAETAYKLLSRGVKRLIGHQGPWRKR